jgi:hypothetical protein
MGFFGMAFSSFSSFGVVGDVRLGGSLRSSE